MQNWDPRGDASTYLLSTYDWTDICHGIALSAPLLLIFLIGSMDRNRMKKPILRPLLWTIGSIVVYVPGLYVGYLLSSTFFNDYELHFIFDGRKVWLRDVMLFVFAYLITLVVSLIFFKKIATEKYPAWFAFLPPLLPFQFTFFMCFPYCLGAS